MIPKQASEYFFQLAGLAPRTYESSLEELSSIIVSQSHNWTKTSSYDLPARNAARLFDEKFLCVSQEDRAILKLALSAKLAIKTPSLVESENLPDSVLAYYPAAFDRVSKDLRKRAEMPFDTTNDPFANIIRFVLALTIPCGAQALDLSSRIPLTSAVLSVPRERSLSSLIRYLRCMGLGVWFRGHTDTAYLKEFNEEGWDKFYLRIAELLLLRKNVRGLVGTSWFYDPQLIDISPRLSYLQLRQIERGAYLMRHRGTKNDIEWATKTSTTRRRLYQEGKYTPIAHSLIWGRNELLSWAKTV